MSARGMMSLMESSEASGLLGEHNKWMAAGQPFNAKAWARVREVINNDMTTTDRADGSGRVRSSNCGSCLRLQWYSFWGFESGFKGNAATMNGTWGHYRMQYAGLAAGWLAEIERRVKTDYLVEGNADGITVDGNIWEFKTTHYHAFKDVRNDGVDGMSAAHLAQITGYIDAYGCDQGHMFYENKASLEIVEVVVPADTERSRILAEDSLRVAQDTPPAVLDDCKRKRGKAFQYCDYTHICRPWEQL